MQIPRKDNLYERNTTFTIQKPNVILQIFYLLSTQFSTHGLFFGEYYSIENSLSLRKVILIESLYKRKQTFDEICLFFHVKLSSIRISVSINFTFLLIHIKSSHCYSSTIKHIIYFKHIHSSINLSFLLSILHFLLLSSNSPPCS